MNFIKGIAKNLGVSVIVIIHDLNLALRFADKYILMKDKRIYSVGGEEVITEKSIKDVYLVDVKIKKIDDKKIIIPI
ncbi:ABC transporter ATP-binding protein [Caloramator sp. mosi_1]|uniref:ABC transporter ATP-binding protein n=1 Tax=Caloramator sp. mosi_1 TaxID=3023090 RepID=UPI0030818E34